MSRIESHLSTIKDPLSIRTKAIPTPQRPHPTTATSSPSSSSTSSSENSQRIFDLGTLDVRSESPTTPPDETSPPLGSSVVPAGDKFEREYTPLLNVHRRSRRPIIPTQDPRKIAAKRTASLGAGDGRTNPPPKLKPWTQKKEVIQSQSLAEEDPRAAGSQLTSNIGDIFVDARVVASDSEQSTARPPTALEISHVTSAENEPSDESDGCQEDPPRRIPNRKEQKEKERLKFDRYRARNRDIRSINEQIKKTMEKPKVLRQAPGWAYVLESPERAPGHLKIGSTTRMSDREIEWKRCEEELIQVEDVIDSNGFDHPSIVESLVHQELHNARRTSFCRRCKKDHDEWFEVDKEDAFKSIGRWRTWIKHQEPYQAYQKPDTIEKQWKLTPYWQWKVKNLPKTLADVDWDAWIHPSQREYFEYWCEMSWGGYYLFLKAHFGRKDERFLLVGISFWLSMHIMFGWACSTWTLIGLLAL